MIRSVLLTLALAGLTYGQDGNVVCWGDNTFSQCDVPEDVFTQLSGSYYHSLVSVKMAPFLLVVVLKRLHMR